MSVRHKLGNAARGTPRIPPLITSSGSIPVADLVPGLNGQELMTEGGVATWVFDPADILIVNNLTTLAATDMAVRGNSETAYVQSLGTYFTYDQTSTLTADAITIVTATGGGRWLRAPIPNLSWAYQASWFLNPTTGNDENSGLTALLPLKTLNELDRRLSTQTLQQTTTISLMGAYATQYIRLTDVRLATNLANVGGNGPFRLIIQGDSSAWTNIFTSNVAGIASFQSVTRVAAGVRYAVTDNNLGVTDPATFVGHRIRLTSGAHTGAITWVLKKLSATQFATGPFMAAIDLTTGDFTAPSIVTPAPGDTYVIEDVVAIKGIEIANGVVRSDLQDGASLSPFSPIVAHVDVCQGALTVNDAADGTILFAGAVHGLPEIPKPMFAYSKASTLLAGFGNGQIYASCFACPTGPGIIVGRMDGTCFLTVGVGVGVSINCNPGDPVGTIVTFANDCTSQGVSIGLQGPGGMQIIDTGLGIYDCVGVPFNVNACTFANFSGGILYGTNPAVTAGGAAVRCQTGGVLRYAGSNKPVITANTPGTNDLQLTQGSWAGAWTAVPLAIPEIGAVIVDNSFDIGRVYQTAIGANIGAANLFPGTPDKGLYTIDVYVAITTAGAAGDQVTVTFAWTDDSQAETLNAISAVSVAAKGQIQTRIVIETDGIATPTWALSFPVKTGAPQLSLRIAARPMQNATA